MGAEVGTTMGVGVAGPSWGRVGMKVTPWWVVCRPEVLERITSTVVVVGVSELGSSVSRGLIRNSDGSEGSGGGPEGY